MVGERNAELRALWWGYVTCYVTKSFVRPCRSPRPSRVKCRPEYSVTVGVGFMPQSGVNATARLYCLSACLTNDSETYDCFTQLYSIVSALLEQLFFLGKSVNVLWPRGAFPKLESATCSFPKIYSTVINKLVGNCNKYF